MGANRLFSSQTRIQRRAIFYDYLLLFLLIATTGFPFFYSSQEFILIGFILSGIVFFNRNLRIEKNIIYIAGLFMVIELFQAYIFDKFDAITILGTLIRILFGYFVARVTGKHFIDYFFRIIYVLAVISLFFYIPSVLSNSFFQFFANDVSSLFTSPFAPENAFYTIQPNIIVYCFHEVLAESARNPGPFWEPGAFSLFLVIAILFRLIRKKQILEKKLILLYIVVVTTVSTAGVIALIVLLISFYLVGKENVAFKYFFAGIFMVGAYFLYTNVSFLGEKALSNIDIAESTTSSRFGSALVDLRDFVKSPLIGWGRGENRYGGKQIIFFSVDQHRNNGVTNLLATYGIFIFVMYFYVYYRNLKNLCRVNLLNVRFAVFALLVILLLGFSQGIFTRPFFYCLLFIGLPIYYIKGTGNTGSNKKTMQQWRTIP
jgi:hypothetical protein